MGLSLKVFGVKYFFCLCVYFFGRLLRICVGLGWVVYSLPRVWRLEVYVMILVLFGCLLYVFICGLDG